MNAISELLFIVFKLVGFSGKAEYHISEGRVDLMLQTNRFIYMMEFKLDGIAEKALQQIHDKHYAVTFLADDRRKLFRVGINFSNRNIEHWLVG